MKKRTVIWLLVAVAVLIGAYLVVVNWKAISERLFPKELQHYEGDGTSVLYNLGAQEDISRIDWKIGENSYSITRNEDGDFVCEEGAALDQTKIKTELLDNLYSIKSSHELGEVSLADYGLDEPWMEYTVYGSTKELRIGEEPESHTVCFGTHNTVTDTCYATVDGGKTVYLLYNKLNTRFGSYETFAVQDTAPENMELNYVGVTMDGETWEYHSAIDGDGTFYSSVLSWYTILEDGYKQPINMDLLGSLYSVYSDLTWDGIVETEATDLAPYGLDDPIRLELRYTYYTGVGENVSFKDGSFVLLVGAPVDDKNTYVMVENSGVVRYLKNDKVEGILNFDPDLMAYHVAVVPEWQTLRKMEITLPDGTTCTCEVRVAESGTSYFIEGVEVEKEDVRSVFLSLFNPAVDGMATEPREQSDAVVKVHFVRDRTTFPDMELYLIPYNSSLCVVDFFDEQRYLVSTRVVDGITKAVTQALEKVK